MEIPKFSDFMENKNLSGDKKSLGDVLKKRIVVTGYKVSSSKYKDKGSNICVKVQFYYADDAEQTKYVFFSGSSVIKDQLDEIKAKLDSSGHPLVFEATVNKVGNYYSFE